MASIVGLIAGLLMARALFGIVAERLAPVLGTSTTVAQVLACLLYTSEDFRTGER